MMERESENDGREKSGFGARLSFLTPLSSLISSLFDGLGVKVIRFGAYGGFFYKTSRTGG